MPYNLPDWAETWCTPPKIPSLPFERCNKEGTVNSIRVFGGLTNALKFILLGSIYSFERDECFFIDESTARMRKRKDTSEQFDSLLQRYFEPMGLSANSADVQRAKQQDRVHVLHAVNDLFRSRHTRRAHGDTTELSTLGINEMDGHAMKKYMMRRLWRPLPEVRNHTCATLDTVHGLHDPYLAFSIRRGDKKEVEHFEYQDLDDYISQAEPLIVKHFDGVVPNIFVATDDCSVLPEFRKMRPEWTFLSECDRMDVEEQGFALADMSTWTKQQTDAHFRKFFVELYGLAIAKVYIGVSTTNGTFPCWVVTQSMVANGYDNDDSRALLLCCL